MKHTPCFRYFRIPAASRIALFVAAVGSTASANAPRQTGDESAHLVSVAAEARSLSAALRRQITVERSMTSLPILVLPRQGSPEQVLRLMASALGASVVPDGRDYSIRRTPADRRGTAERQIVRVKSWLAARWRQSDQTAAKLALVGGLEAQYVTSAAEYARVLEANRALPLFNYVEPTNNACFVPAGRLLRKIIDRMTPEELSSIPLNTPIFYSNHPNPVERLLPNTQELLATFASEQSKLATVLPSKGVVIPIPEEPRVLVQITRRTSHLEFILYVYDPAGQFVAQCGDMTRLSMLWAPPFVEGSPFFGLKDSRWQDLADSSKLYVDTESFRHAGFKLDPAREAAEPWIDVMHRKLHTKYMPPAFLHPERLEPNDYVVREGLLGIAKSYPGRPFAAVVPDDLWPDSFGAVKDYRVNVDAFLHFLDKDGAEVSQTNEGTIVRLSDPDSQGERIADRKTLGEAVRHFATSQSIGVREWCSALAALAPLGRASVGGWFLGTVLESVPAFSGKTVYDPTFARFLGTMTDGEWESLCRSGTTTLSSAESIEAFLQVVSHEGAPVLGGNPSKPGALDRPIENLIAEGVDQAIVNAKVDRTTAVRVWVPGQGWQGVRNSPSESPRFLGNMLGTRLLPSASASDAATAIGQFLSSLRFKYFIQERFRFTIPLPSGREMSQTYIDDADGEAPEVGFDDLPSAIRDALYAGITSPRKSPKRMSGPPGR